MGDLYNILNLPETASKEELKEAFIAWKKEQQEILGKGTREEQDITTQNITKVTVLYKKAMAREDLIYKTNQSNKVPNEDSSLAANESNLTQQVSIAPKQIKQDKKKKTRNRAQRRAVEHNDQNIKIAVVAVVSVLVIMLMGSIIYKSYKNTSFIDILPSFTRNFLFNEKQKRSTENKSSKPVKPVKPTTPEPPKPPKTDNGNKSGLNSTTNDNKSQKNNNQQNQNPGKTEVQRQAIQTLMDFHSNITSKNYRAAYNCLSQSFQDRMRYDGWAAGFKTTVSSTPLDIKVYSESANKVVLTYNLQAVDNPGGTRIFSGTTVVIKTQNGWKINEITNKAK